MNRWASMAAASVTVFLSAATVGGVVASQGVFDHPDGGADEATATAFQVLDAPGIVDGLPFPGATVVVVDGEPIVMTRDVVVPDVQPGSTTGRWDDDDDDDDDGDRDDHDDDRDDDHDDDHEREDDDD
ncbi:MAG: hypothetical protein Kow0010_02370 [Dehalococcoidia bacterium]